MSKAQEDLEKFLGIAEELGLEDDEANSFVSSAMKRKGHRPKLSWEDADTSDGDGSGGDFFSSITGGKRRETRPTRPQRKSGGSDWQYGRSA